MKSISFRHIGQPKQGNPHFKDIIKKGEFKKNLGWGNQKGGKIFRKKGGTQLKLSLGIDKDKNGINFFNDLPVAAKGITSFDIYFVCHA